MADDWEFCPSCREGVKKYATRCPHCTTVFDEPVGTIESEPDGPIGKFFISIFIIVVFGGGAVLVALVIAFVVGLLCNWKFPLSALVTFLAAPACSIWDGIRRTRKGEKPKEFVDYWMHYFTPQWFFYGPTLVGLGFIGLTYVDLN